MGDIFLIGAKLCLIVMVFFLKPYSIIGQDIVGLKEQEPFKLSGQIHTRFTFFNANGRPSNREDLSWYIQGSPTISVYGIEIPFSFMLSEQQRDFRQPFNQFGLSPKYKWVTAHLGHRNIKWSDFSLAGHNFFGGGFELTPGNFRIGAIHGQFLRAIEPSNTETSFQTTAFRRIGSAFKIGYGTQKNNFDLVVFRAEDQENSINISNLNQPLSPSDNVVASIVTHHDLFKKLTLDVEYAKSVFTPNILDQSQIELEDLIANIFSFWIDENQTTQVGDAIKATMAYKEKQFDIKLRYDRIDPNFKSLGAYFFLTDIEKLTIAPRFKFWKNKLVIGGSYGLQKDNLDKDKRAQTKRNIYSGNVNFQPTPKYNLSANYTNYGITQKPGTQPTIRQEQLSQVNQQLTLTQNINLVSKDRLKTHFLLLLWNFQDLADDNNNTAQFSEFKSHIISPKYNFSYVPWRLTAGIGYNYSVFELPNRETKNYGPIATLSKNFKNPNISISSNFKYYQIENNGAKESDAYIIVLNSKYKMSKKHQFLLRAHINNGNIEGVNPLNYSETKIDFGYAYSF